MSLGKPSSEFPAKRDVLGNFPLLNFFFFCFWPLSGEQKKNRQVSTGDQILQPQTLTEAVH